MPTVDETIQNILDAPNWNQRVARVRQIPANHGYNEHARIYAEVARQLYVEHLTPDFAHVPLDNFFELPAFEAAYVKAVEATTGFTKVSVEELTVAIQHEPSILLPLRVITGLLSKEFAASTTIVGKDLDLTPLGSGKIDSMERLGTKTTEAQARVAAETLDRIMRSNLFIEPPADWKSKQRKPDTEHGWGTAQHYAAQGIPYSMFLHQRHYGGAFQQLLNATSERRGDLIEEPVEELFKEYGILYIRTGSHKQSQIAAQFDVTVHPAPDFVIYDHTGLRAMLECKAANDGGTARDKAPRFERLRDESVRLGGIPLIAVLGGLGWERVNDTLGPVIRDCDGRVFTVANLQEMLTVAPFPSLIQ